jgi:hypothetical protein
VDFSGNGIYKLNIALQTAIIPGPRDNIDSTVE